MQLSFIDIAIVVAYIIASLAIGIWISKRASKNIKSYFLGNNELPWYALGLSNASGMFDISGTMWMVYLLFVYGLKSVYIPWLWPSFNQIFMMVFLSIWLRRSGVMTGAEWIKFRFGTGVGANLSHIVVVVFALMSVLGFLAYGFLGIGKFAAVFLPWQLSADPGTNEIYYGLIITAVTTVYVVKGGMFSVVFTEVMQFFIMTIACIAVGIIAMVQVSPETLANAVPGGWTNVFFGWELGLDWSGRLESANQKIADDGYSMFTIFFMLMVFKGVLQSIAGPAPNYDMQRVLSARSPIEAAKMSWFVNVVLLIPRYMLITGLTVLALAFFMDELREMGSDVDFELILPFVLKNYIPVGLLGLLVAGLLAAFMSTFAATVNAAPAYVVNDIYKRYINNHASDKRYVRLSYVVSVLFVVLGTIIGLYVASINDLIQWLVSALYGGYTAANLLKWIWWRFNGFGYFVGMLTGIVAAVPMAYVESYTGFSALGAFPILFGVCLAGCLLGTLLTAPDDMDVLKNFYLKTRPWGFWGPVIVEVQKDNPITKPNRHLRRDTFNVLVGIVWQTSITASAIFLVIKDWKYFLIAITSIAVTSVVLKITWYDTLEDYPSDIASEMSPPQPPPLNKDHEET